MEADQAEFLTTISSFLDAHSISYMITGAWSVIFYGRPRASHDIDFVVDLYEKDIDRTLAAMRELPTEFSVQPKAVETSIKERDMFNIIHLPTYLKLDFWLLQADPFDQSRFKRRKRVEVLGRPMVFASREDTILQKLRWYKQAKLEKHIVDAAFVYQIQKQLDKKYLDMWAQKLGVTRYLKQLASIDLEQYV